jgi:histidine triad (HIT) family protein
MTDSIFTKIIRGDIPSYKIYEDDLVFAILDNNPLSDAHVLVITKRQVDKFYDLPTTDYTALWQAVQKVAHHMEKILGVRVGLVAEGLEVPHAHIHLVPLYDRDVLKLHHGYPVNTDSKNLTNLAEKLRLDDK